MKLILVSLLVLGSLCLSAQWRLKYDGADAGNDVKSVSFINPSTGYIAAYNWIGFTTDSGATVQKRFVTINNVNWNNYPVNLTFGFYIEDVHAFSADTLLISGDYGLEPSILYSTNGGATWLVVFHRNIPINTVNIYNSVWQMEFPGRGSIGFAVHGDEILRTANRGQTWQVVKTDYNQELFDISFGSQQTGYAAGPNRFLKSTNGGNSWSVMSTPPFEMQELFAYSDQHVFANSANGDSYYSSNGGASWMQTNANAFQRRVEDLYYINDSTGYAAAGATYQTRNRGKTWELMDAFGQAGPVYKFRFWNDQLAWACTGAEDVLITTNGGGISHVKAFFTVNSSLVCTNNTVQLINQSHSGYTYQWFRNGVSFANTYNAGYTAGATPDSIKLVVSNGIESDTMVEYVNATASTALTLNVNLRKDTVCSNGSAAFDIFNSRTDVIYQVGRPCCGYTSGVYGNGGTLTLYAGVNANNDSTINTFIVSAYLNGDCGVQRASGYFPVHLVPVNPPAGYIQDTICTQAPFTITITDTKVGYQYWADPGYPKVNGNGGNITLPCRIESSIANFNIDNDGTLMNHRFRVYAQHAATGCGSDFHVTEPVMIGRRTVTNFDVLGYEWMTGDNLAFKNKSKRGDTWLWRFPDGGNAPTNTMAEPNNISYTSGGAKMVKLISVTKEGCKDSATRSIEIFTRTGPVPGENICAGPMGNITDSIAGWRQYMVSRSIYEDEFGSRIIAGGYTEMYNLYGFYPTGYEGWFAYKVGKTGNVLWALKQRGGEDYFTYNQNSHLIVEQAIGDSLGYTYLYGHALNRRYVTANETDRFNIPKNCSFLICISPTGNIVWVKTFYNRNAFSDDTAPDYSGGTILRGKGDDIYVVTHRHAGERFFMDNTQLVDYYGSVTGSGMILHLDRKGNLKRFRNFPITENNMRRYEIYSANSYDSLAKAKWAPDGKLVMYGLLNTAEMGGNSIDGVTAAFNTATIKSALLFFDTANLQVTSIKPIYKNIASGPVSIPVETFTVDENGNYYASFSRRMPIPESSLAYQYDSTKPKSFISGFNASGSLIWTKQSDGLQPRGMEFAAGQLKVAGTNYTYAGFTNGNLIYFSNQSPTLRTVKKLTVIGDTSTDSGVAAYGLGSLDIVVASFNPTNGAVLKLQVLGSELEDESIIMSKGQGQQMWVAGTVGSNVRNVINNVDTMSAVHTYKIAADNNCTTTYKNPSPFVQLDLLRLGTNCADSLYKLYWSSNAAGPLNLSFSLNNGASYTSIATGLPASNGFYNFNVAQSGAQGNVLFKIEDPANSLSDTSRTIIVPRATPLVTIKASDPLVCGNNPITFTADSTNGGPAPVYQWFLNTQYMGNQNPITFSTFNNGWEVKAIMISNEICVTKQRDTSNVITIAKAAVVVPSVTISGNTIVNQGSLSFISALPLNGGATPAWQWQDSTANHGWQNIANATASTHNYTPITTGDKLRCVLTSNAVCATPASVPSLPITFTVNAVTGIDPTPASGFGIRLFPNPTLSSVFIDSLKLSDRWISLDVIGADGRLKLAQINIQNKRMVEINARRLASGMYTVVLRRKQGVPVYVKFIKL